MIHPALPVEAVVGFHRNFPYELTIEAIHSLPYELTIEAIRNFPYQLTIEAIHSFPWYQEVIEATQNYSFHRPKTRQMAKMPVVDLAVDWLVSAHWCLAQIHHLFLATVIVQKEVVLH